MSDQAQTQAKISEPLEYEILKIEGGIATVRFLNPRHSGKFVKAVEEVRHYGELVVDGVEVKDPETEEVTIKKVPRIEFKTDKGTRQEDWDPYAHVIKEVTVPRDEGGAYDGQAFAVILEQQANGVMSRMEATHREILGKQQAA